MFSRLLNLFKRRKKLKNFSLTFTDATEGEDKLENFNPRLAALLNKVREAKSITHEETNILIEHFFNKPPLKECLYKFNEAMIKGSSFSITSVKSILNEEGIPVNLIITLDEETYNSGLKVMIPIDEFHDFLTPIKLNKPNPEEKTNAS